MANSKDLLTSKTGRWLESAFLLRRTCGGESRDGEERLGGEGRYGEKKRGGEKGGALTCAPKILTTATCVAAALLLATFGFRGVPKCSGGQIETAIIARLGGLQTNKLTAIGRRHQQFIGAF